jgi:hypothetical protein
MIDVRLRVRLGPLARMLRQARLFRALALCWAAAAVTGLVLFGVQVLLHHAFPWPVWIVPLTVGLALAVVAGVRQKRSAADIHAAIRQLEQDQPGVRHLLAAAAEQEPAEKSGGLNYLQLRVIDEALRHPRNSLWKQQAERRVVFAQAAHAFALIALISVLYALNQATSHHGSVFASMIGGNVTVTPGDTQVERGTGLVVAARFGGNPPAEATLVVNCVGGKQSRIPMARRLADPIFGASVPEISEAGVYHVEYRDKKTPEYKISVFEYPALLQADASLVYPAYTGLANRTIQDTLRVSAVQGSRVTYTLQLNKPVAQARLAGGPQPLALSVQTNAVAILPDFLLTNSVRYTLELVDADGRSNKFPTEFVFQALTNQRPEVKLDFPRGDRRVSRLEELQLEAHAADDFGLLRYGIGYGMAGGDPKLIELGQTAPANTLRRFSYLIPLEKLDVQPDQTVAYFAWADDYGPDGKPRRTYGDIHMADIRPFDEAFRQGEGGEGNGDDAMRLIDMQKQILIATWNLERDEPGVGSATHP